MRPDAIPYSLRDCGAFLDQLVPTNAKAVNELSQLAEMFRREDARLFDFSLQGAVANASQFVFLGPLREPQKGLDRRKNCGEDTGKSHADLDENVWTSVKRSEDTRPDECRQRHQWEAHEVLKSVE